MPSFCESEHVQRTTRIAEQLAYSIAPVLQLAVRAPRNDDEIGVLRCSQNCLVVFGTNRVVRRPQSGRIG